MNYAYNMIYDEGEISNNSKRMFYNGFLSFCKEYMHLNLKKSVL